jgi:isoquinoline 1-oxidoreductase
MSTRVEMDRRSFIELLGGGILIIVSMDPEELLAQERRRDYPTDVNAYLRIGEDGRVSVFSSKIEMGQGVMTSLAQMLAEELGVPLESIEMVLGDTDRCPWDAGTFGSRTTRFFGPALRAAGAEARAVLLQLGSQQLAVPADRLVARSGVVSAKDDPSRSITYGQLAKGQAITRTLDQKAVLRSVSEFTVMGQSPLRLDARDKVTGAAQYAGDVRLPGMLYARLLRPPAHGAKLVKADTSAAAELPGVTVVNEQDLVAVLHADPEAAAAALAHVKAEWTPAPPGSDQDGVFDELLAKAPAPEVKQTKGILDGEPAPGARRVEHTYHKGYVAHAPIEPHTATAALANGKLTVWASTQTPFPLHDRLAPMLGLDPTNVRVITPYVGGGFGGKSAGRQAEEAARLAKATGRPVQVAFTRAEEFFYDTFDPAAVVKVASAVDEAGRITLWDYDVYFAGERGADLFYDVPNARRRVYGGRSDASVHRFAVGPWRAPGANMNVWARESQIDVMAAAARIDPLEFRLRNIKDERMRRCLQEAARTFGWTPAAGPSGRGWGIACGVDSGTYVALMAEVKVDRERGTVKVGRVVCAQDMGVVVNPVGATMQIEGCITMGLGYVFSEELRFRGGQLVTENYDSYEIPRFSWLPPAIETVLVRNDELAPQGGGEPAIVPMGGVMANAVFDATGVRLFRLPMTPARLKAALDKSGAGRSTTSGDA